MLIFYLKHIFIQFFHCIVEKIRIIKKIYTINLLYSVMNLFISEYNYINIKII